jgi:hypothetical protein
VKKNPLYSVGETLKTSWGHLLSALALLGVAVVSLCAGSWFLAVAAVVVTDTYVALMLWSAAQLASHKDAQGKTIADAETWPGLPRRDASLLQLAMLLAALV